MRITVHVVDDHPIVRQGVSFVLDADPDLVYLGSSATAAAAASAVQRDRPQVVLLDVRLDDGDVVTTVGALLRAHPHTKIILFTADPSHPRIPAALRAGAVAVVAKDAAPSELRQSIRDAAVGQLSGTPSAAAEPMLTARQQQVLELVASGMTNVEVAQLLGLQPATVKDYWKLTMQRLGVRNRAEAIAVAYRLGLL